MTQQATINIGTLGHVSHGKSTLVRAISGIHTVRFKKELERNITIRLGYANAKIYEAEDNSHRYTGKKSNHPNRYFDKKYNCWMKMVRHVSFVDCPGHDVLMSTMLTGASVMDAAFLLISGSDKCPQPQTSEHLAAADIMDLQKIAILQNKIDIITRDKAIEQYSDIKDFTKNTIAENSEIIPISAQMEYNIDVVLKYIVEKIPIPPRDLASPARMMIVRSFDVNKPGINTQNLVGGIIGGSILCGTLHIGQQVEIRPGYIIDGVCHPLITKIISLQAEENKLDSAIPGGLIGVGTGIDPSLSRSDKLVGHVLGAADTLPEIRSELVIKYKLMRTLIGTKAHDKIHKISNNEQLTLNIGSMSVISTVLEKTKTTIHVQLVAPVCCDIGERASISRKINKTWRLIGCGSIQE